MHIDTSELGRLRSIRDDELLLMLSWRNAVSVRSNMYTQHEISPAEHMAWWERVKKSVDHRYFIYETNDGPLGVACFTSIDLLNRSASWAFYAKPGAPKGTGSRIEWLILEHAFGVLQLHKLSCEVLAFNTPVIRMHEKFGFKVEGVLREQCKVGDDFVDVYRLGMLAGEWFQLRISAAEKLFSLRADS